MRAARPRAHRYARRVATARIDKQALVTALLAKLEAELANMTKAANTAREAATHEEAKPENDKDTRALEASYLAAGQAERVRDLEAALKTVSKLELLTLGASTPIQTSAVVVLEDDDEVKTTFFLAPYGGGTNLTVGGVSVQVITPKSPLGQALLGRTKNDVVELRAKGGLKEMTIVDVW